MNPDYIWGTPVEAVIEDGLTELLEHEVTSDEYSKGVDNLSKLADVRNKLKPETTQVEQKPKTDHIGKESILNAGVSLLSLLMVLKYEQMNIITGKAFSMLPKFTRF